MSDVDATLTVEEAASRLGVSVATARRMAADGRIPALKSGKQWIVDGRSLARLRPRRRVSARPLVDLDQALRFVQRTDLTEAWVPDVLRFADGLAARSEVVAAAQGVLDGNPPGPAIEVEVDKTVFFTRWATLLHLQDRVAYQAVVGSFAERVDAQTAPSVFSARTADDPRYFLKRGTRQWVAWRQFVADQLCDDVPWLIKTDLIAYFDTIPHNLLIADIETLNVDRSLVGVLAEMLRTWAAVPGLGLPQGPNASRLLGNLYMLPVDRAMLDAGWNYSRYLDDVRILASTKEDAIQAVRHFQRECRARGLIVSSAKTSLLFGDAARNSLAVEADLAAAEYLAKANATALARRELKAILRRALRPSVRVDERRAKFSLWRLALLRDAGMVGQVLRRLDDLAPVASVVAAYLRPFISRAHVVDGLGKFLGDASRSHSPYLTTWIFACMLEHPGTLPARWADQAAKRVKDRNEPTFLRSVAAVVMARGGRAVDVAWIRSDVNREHDPTVLRGYAVALHWAHALDKTTQRHLVARSRGLAATVDYLQGRNVLPSLVYARAQLRLA